MVKVQDDIMRLKSIYLKIINYLSSINFPIYILMAVLASSLVPLILGEKWTGAVGIFQILSIYALVRSTTNPAGSLLLSRGRADIGFWWSIGEFSLMPMIIYIGSHWGLIGVAMGLLIFQVLMLLPNWFFIVKKMCNASFKEYFMVQIRPLVATILSVGLTYLIVGNMGFNDIFKIVLISIVTSVLYFVLSYWLNQNFIEEIKEIIIKKVNK